MTWSLRNKRVDMGYSFLGDILIWKVEISKVNSFECIFIIDG